MAGVRAEAGRESQESGAPGRGRRPGAGETAGRRDSAGRSALVLGAGPGLRDPGGAVRAPSLLRGPGLPVGPSGPQAERQADDPARRTASVRRLRDLGRGASNGTAARLSYWGLGCGAAPVRQVPRPRGAGGGPHLRGVPGVCGGGRGGVPLSLDRFRTGADGEGRRAVASSVPALATPPSPVRGPSPSAPVRNRSSDRG